MGLHNVIVEGDSLNVVNAINGDGRSIEWQGRQDILECRKLLVASSFWYVYHVSRCRNGAAHNLAKWANCNHFFGHIDHELLSPSVFCDRGGTQDSACIDVLPSSGLNDND